MSEQSFYLFRHGHTEITKLQAETGLAHTYGNQNLTADLTAEAAGPVTRLAEFLKQVGSDVNLSSGLKRCLQTIETVAAITGKDFIVDRRLEETGTETIAETEARLSSLLKDDLISRAGIIMMCTHGSSISALKNLITGKTQVEDPLTQFPKPGVLVIIENGQIREIDFN